MNNWQFDKQQIDELLPEIGRWLAPFTFKTSCEIDDRDHNIDLVVDGRTYSQRGRWIINPKNGHHSFRSYWREFTIRATRPNRTEDQIELGKIRSGASRADQFFYFWADRETKTIKSATLIDLTRFKACVDTLPWSVGENEDRGDSSFRAYSIQKAADAGCVIDHRYAPDFQPTYWQRQLVRHVAHARCAQKRVA